MITGPALTWLEIIYGTAFGGVVKNSPLARGTL